MKKFAFSSRERIGLFMVMVLSLVAVIQSFHHAPASIRKCSVGELIKAVQRQETRWDIFRQALWQETPKWFQKSFPSLQPVSVENNRLQACQELGHRGTNAVAAVPCLLTLLKHPIWQIRLAAVRSLAEIRPPIDQVKATLVELLASIPRQDSMAFEANYLIYGLSSLARKWSQPSDPLAEFLRRQLSAATRQALAEYRENSTRYKGLLSNLVEDLIRIRLGPSIYDAQRFAGVPLRTKTKWLLEEHPQGERLRRLNRRLLEDAYPREIRTDILNPELLT